jgi:hypothetical protein
MRIRRYLFIAMTVFALGCDNRFLFDNQAADTGMAPVDTDSSAMDTDTAVDMETDTNILFQTGFENGLSFEIAADGDLTLDTTVVRSGRYSMRSAVSAAQTAASIGATFPPVTSGSIYYRAYYYVTNPPDDK